MPQVIPAIIAFLAANAPAITAAAAVATAGTTIGETLANQPGGGPSQPAAPAQPAQPQAAPAPAQNPALASYVASQAPQAQAQTGGSLAPPAFSELVANLTGNPGDQPGVQQILFGSGGGGQGGLTDMLAQLSPPPAQSLTTPMGGG